MSDESACETIEAIKLALSDARLEIERLRSILGRLNDWHPSHYGHFDRQGTAGANCPQCKDDGVARDLIREGLHGDTERSASQGEGKETIVYEHAPGCFCQFCMDLDRVRMFRAQLEQAQQRLEKSVSMLDAAQRPTATDLGKIIDAQRYDLSGTWPIKVIL